MLVMLHRDPAYGARAHAGRLASDCRGAMFVMGIPLIFFMIGLLYFVIGLGEELVLRERMQDAADAGAMTGAMVYARGMNLIALLNQLMAALVGLLIMVRMLEAVMTATIFIAGALAWPTAGASLGVVPGVEVVREEANAAYEELKAVVDPIVEAVHGLELGIQYGMPAIAELQTIDIIKSFDNPVSSGAVPGFEIPGQLFLPLKNGRWPKLCKEAGKDAGALIGMPLGAIIPVDQVKDVVAGAIGGLAETFSAYFCDSGSASGLNFPDTLPDVPIPDDVRFEENIPRLPEAERCEAVSEQQGADASGGYARTADNLTQALTDQEKQERESKRQASIDAKNVICQRAAEELALSQMAEDGGPTGSDDAGLHKSAVTGDECGYMWSDKNFYRCPQNCRQTSCEQFQSKINGAYAACRPGATEGITAYSYQRRDLQ